MSDEDPSVDDIAAAVAGLIGKTRAAAPARALVEGSDPAPEHLRMVEALLFASAEPLPASAIAQRLPEGADVGGALSRLKRMYAGRGVELLEVAGKWRFQTAPDLGWLLREERDEPRKLSRAGLETLAIVAYHQPCTRAEIEAVRGVAVSKGTLDTLVELGWVRPRGRRRAPGKPLTYGTTDAFLEQFSLASIDDLPGKEDLKAAGLLDTRLPADFDMPRPKTDDDGGEDPLDPAEFHQDYLAETKE